MAEYSEGICGDGAAILKDGAPMRVHEIVAELNLLRKDAERYRWLRHGDNDDIVICKPLPPLGEDKWDYIYLPRNENLDIAIDSNLYR